MTEQGLRGNHTMCLYNLGRHPGGLTCAQLTTLCEEDKAAISRTLAELETRGYVRREAPPGSGKYRAKLLLTEKGQAAANFIRQRAESIVEQGGEGLTDSQREVMYASLSLIMRNLQTLSGENC